MTFLTRAQGLPARLDPGTAVDNYAADDDESYVETEQY